MITQVQQTFNPNTQHIQKTKNKIQIHHMHDTKKTQIAHK